MNSLLAADIAAYHLQNCAGDVWLFLWPMSEVRYFGDMYTLVHTVAACSWLRSADHGDIVVPRAPSTWFGCRSFHMCGPKIWNKLSQHLQSTDTREQFKCILLRAGYLSVRMAEGVSDRHWLKACLINGLTHLLSYLLPVHIMCFASHKDKQ